MKPKALETLWPLSPMQEGMLFECLAAADPGLYLEQCVGVLEVPAEAGEEGRGEPPGLDSRALRGAFDRVLARHPALRASFFWEEVERPLQAIHRRLEMPWRDEDWSALEEPEAERRFDALLAEDRERGFDLSRAPLHRFALVRTPHRGGGARYRFAWTFHHLLLDGWSLFPVLEEVLALYAGERRGEAVELAPRRSYGDFLAWLSGPGALDEAAARSFWRRELGDPTAAPAAAATAADDGEQAMAESRLPAPVVAALESEAKRAGLTAAALAEGAFGLLLARWSASREATFGTVVSGRPPGLVGVERMIGLFVNTLPARVAARPGDSAESFLRRVQERAAERRRFEHTPLAKLRRWVGAEAEAPLFEAILAFENYPRSSHDLESATPASGLRVLALDTLERLSFPLGLGVAPGEEWTLRLLYRTSRYAPTTARRMLDGLETLFRELARGGALSRPVSALPLLSRAERHQLRHELASGPEATLPGVEVLERIAEHARRSPDAVAIEPAAVPPPGQPRGAPITYRQLARRIERIAGALAARGVRLGDVVAITCPRTPEWVVAALAVGAAGAAYLPLDPDYPPRRRRLMLEDSGARAIVVVGRRSRDELLPEREVTVPRWALDELETAGGEALPLPPAEAPAYMIYTSGSTGRPKGALLGRAGWGRLIAAQLDRFAPQPGERLSQLTSPSFDAAVWEIGLALAAGATLCLVTPGEIQRAGGVGETARLRRLDHVSALPSLLAAGGPAGRSPHTIYVGGEALPRAIVERWAPGRRLVNCYGPVEITMICSAGEPAIEREPHAGTPLAAARLFVLATAGSLEPVPAGVTGELWVGGPGLAFGYHRRPAATAAAFRPDPFSSRPGARLYRTGDLACRRPDGRLVIRGRADHQVKIRGHRVEAGEVEAALLAHPAVAQALVAARPLAGELQLVAYLVAAPGAVIEADELRRFVAARLPAVMVPRHLVVLERFPLTPNLKIDRRALPDPAADARAEAAGDPAPQRPASELEARLAASWSEVLGVARVGRDEHFFDLGGDSILSLQLAGRLRREGLDVSPADLFEHPTVARLAAHVERCGQGPGGGTGGEKRADEQAPGEPIPLTPVQRVFLERDPADPHHFNFGVVLEPAARLEPGALARALVALVRRHAALRLRFRRGDRGWEQRLAGAETAHEPLVALDLGALPEAATRTALARAADGLQASLDVERGPLLRALLATRREGDRLLLAVHHLAADAVSMGLLVAELETLLAGGEPAPVPTSFDRWARAVDDRLRRASESTAAPPVVRLFAGPPASEGEARLLRRELAPEIAAALTGGAARRARCDPPTLLAAALAAALTAWAGLEAGERLALHLEGHGRDLPLGLDAGATVGWLTTLRALVVEVPRRRDPAAFVRAVKRALAAADPLRGAEVEAEVVLNYLGRPPARGGGLLRLLPEDDAGAPRSARQRRVHRLELNAYLAGERGDERLRLIWGYAPRELPAAELEALSRTLETAAGELAALAREAPGALWAPADLPLARLGGELAEDELERLLAALPALPEDVYALAPLQQGILFHAVAADGEASEAPYVEQLHCLLEGAIDPERLRAAWRRAVERHPVLRSAFVHAGLAEPVQAVLPAAAVTLRFAVEDWRDERDAGGRFAARLAAERRGFDLTRPPLLSLLLTRVGDERWRFAWTHHHLLLDGWSAGQLLAEVFALTAHGESAELPPVRPFREHVAWLASRDRAAAREFWRRELRAAASAAPALPPRRGRGTDGGRPVREITRTLGLDAGEAIAAWARRRRLTPSTLVEGAWALLMARWSGAPVALFGSVVSGRPPELADRADGRLGLFINTVPVAVRVEPQAAPAEWLAALQARRAERQPHEWAPLPEIRRWAGVDDGGRALFDTLVLFESYPLDASIERAAGELGVSEAVVEDRTEVPLVLTVLPGPPLELRVQFETARVDRSVARRALDAVERLLAAFAADTASRLDELPVLGAGERQQVLVETAGPAGRGDDPAALLAAAARRFAELPALIDPEADREWSFAELARRARRRAAELAPRRSPRAVDEAVLGGRAEAVVELLACLLAGVPYLPLDPAWPEERKRRLRAAAEELGAEGDAAGAAAYLLYTSGSTGEPKGVVVPRRALARLMRAAGERYGLRPGDRVLAFSSLAFDVAAEELFAGWAAGATVVLPSAEARASFGGFTRFVALSRVSVLNLSASFWRAWSEHLERRGETPPAALRLAVVGNEPLLAGDLARWLRLDGPPLLDAYGPTEATVTALVHAPLAGEAETGAAAALAVGRPLAGVTARVTDRALAALPIGAPGELVLGGEALARGYLGRPAATAEAFRPDPRAGVAVDAPPGGRLYRSGDRARRRPDGAVELLGRLDRQLKIRGVRVEPGEVEAVLAAHPAVAAAAVTAMPSAGADRLVAYLEPATDDELGGPRAPGDGTGEPTDGDLGEAVLRFARAELPSALVPAVCVVVDRLPRTAGGKVDVAALPLPEPPHRPTPRTPAVRPGAEGAESVEALLARIWGEVLGLEGVAPDDDFFALGGDSILSLRVADRARAHGLEIAPRELFARRTPAALAAVTRRTDPAEDPPGGGTPAADAPLLGLQHFFLAAEPIAPEHWNQAIVLEVAAGVEAAAVERALAAVLERHAALRTAFARSPLASRGERPGGGWRQRVAAHAEATLRRLDLGALAPAARGAGVAAAAAALHRGFALDRPPLLAAGWVEGAGDERARLLLVAHHLVIDAVSWRVIAEDLERALAGEPLPAALSAARWAQALADWARSAAGREQAAAWPVPAEPPPLPADDARAPDLQGDAEVVSRRLAAAPTRALLERAATAYGNTPEELVLAAALLVVARLRAAPGDAEAAVLAMLEGHGRRPPRGVELDAARCVGALTALFPLGIELPSAPAARGEALRRVKEALRRVPDGGVGFGALVAAGTIEGWPSADLSFNYLGRAAGEGHGAKLSWGGEAPGPAADPRQRRRFAFDLNAVLRGERLELHWAYGRRHRRPRAEALADAWRDELEALIEHACDPRHAAYTPADFPLAGLGAAELEALALPARDARGAARPVADLYPLTPMQQGLVFHSLTGVEGGGYAQQLWCELAGELDATRFRAAWERVVQRHDVLRTALVRRPAGEPLQAVYRAPALPWVEAAWPEEEADERLALHLAADARRPLDLETPPPMRFALFTAGRRSFFVWTHHHLLLDGWSTARVLAEVLALSLPGDEAPRLAPAHPYRELVAWQRRRAASERSAREAFWRRTLRGWAGPTPLPLERAASAGPAGMGAVRRGVDAARVAELEALGRQRGLTLPTLVQGAWGLVLGRLAGGADPALGRDVLFGVTVSGRATPAAELPAIGERVGLLINTLPRRLRPAPERTLGDWLDGLAEEQRAFLPREHDPLVEIRAWSGVAPGRELFDTLLVYESYPVDAALRAATTAGDGPRVERVEAIDRTHYPLTLTVLPLAGGGLELHAAFDRSRLAASAAARLLALTERALAAQLAPPATPLGALPLLGAAERHRLSVEERPRRRSAGPPEPLWERFLRRARSRPEAPALVFEHAGERRVWSYGELAERARAVAAALDGARDGALDDAGGDLVVIDRPRGPERIAAILGCAAAGRPYLPLDPEAPEARRRRLADEARAAPRVGRGRHPEAPAYVLYTSGSTGRPKGVVVPRAAVDRLFDAAARHFDLEAGGAWTLFHSTAFDFSVWELWGALAHGAPLVVVDRDEARDPLAFARRLAAERVAALSLTPSALAALLAVLEASPRRAAELAATLRWVVCGGEALSAAVAGAFFRLFPEGPELIDMYGITETTVHVTFERVRREDLGEEGRRAPSIGRPLDDLAVYLLDAAGRLAALGAAGEIAVAGAGLAQGYLGRPAATAERFVPDPFSGVAGGRLYASGDLARRRADGRLDFLGRRDAQVQLRGFRVEPGEVAAQLAEHPAVARAEVLARPGADGEPALVAYVAPRPGATAEPETLRAWLGERLPAYMLPAFVVPLGELPLTPNGKLDVAALPDPLAGALAGRRGERRAPASALERVLAGAWEEVLSLAPGAVALDDSFFSLGGHSLLAVQLLTWVRETFEVELPIRQLFEQPTVAGLAAALERELGEAARETAELLLEIAAMSDDQVAAEIAPLARREAEP